MNLMMLHDVVNIDEMNRECAQKNNEDLDAKGIRRMVVF